MTAMTENCPLQEDMEPQVPEVDAMADTKETSGEVPEASQSADAEAVERMDRREEQEVVQQDGEEDCPAKKVLTPEKIKWEDGAQCRAVWSVDGKIYPATVVTVDGERCRVRFGGYGNEEDMELSALQSLSAPVQTQNSQLQVCLSQEWKPGSRCRAVYSADGLVYRAVILWVKDQRCRVRYDEYNNEEEMDVCSLLHPDELHGPSRAASATKGSSWKFNPTNRRRRRDEGFGDRGGERGSPMTDDPDSKIKAQTGNQNKAEKDATEKMTGDQANRFLPFAAPQMGSLGPMSFLPPPPPLWTFSGKQPGDCPDVDNITNMLMLWYMCGFHTGTYLAQQKSTPSSKD